MANTKTGSKTTKKTTTKKTKDVEEKEVVKIQEAVEETIEETPEVVEDETIVAPEGEETTPVETGYVTEGTVATSSEEATEDSEEIADDEKVDPDKEPEETPKVSAEEVKDFDFDKFNSNPVKQEDLIIPATPVVVREKEVHVARPLFPPSKYTQKTVVKKFH